MKNDIMVEEVLDLKKELDMSNIMKLQDGITKEDAVAIIDNKMSVEEVVEMKEAVKEVSRLEGITIESNKFPNFGKEGLDDMNILKINEQNNDEVRFTEVIDQSSKEGSFEILDSVRNTDKVEKKEKRKKLKMKMRPLRVKVMKPDPVEEEEDESEILDPMNDTFGLKNVDTNDDLVLDPEPAVPGRPVSTKDLY